jgi:dolichyl-phosphate beta-glucosyltransferase
MTTPYLSIIVPSYNGGDAMTASLASLERFVQSQTFSTELVLVDDGSEPYSAGLLAEFAATRPWVNLRRHTANSGKGCAVVTGMLAARGAFRVFTDADLAYPVCQIGRVLRVLEQGADVVVANRVHRDSRYTMSPSYFNYLFSRHLMSRAFNAAVRATVLPGVHDTQAGLKGFTAAAAKEIFSRVTVARFGFDIELLVTAKLNDFRIVESPVDFRYDNEPTTVRFAADAFVMLRDLITISRNSRRGHYTTSHEAPPAKGRPVPVHSLVRVA